jgi:hypothetical protein
METANFILVSIMQSFRSLAAFMHFFLSSRVITSFLSPVRAPVPYLILYCSTTVLGSFLLLDVLLHAGERPWAMSPFRAGQTFVCVASNHCLNEYQAESVLLSLFFIP